MKKHPEHKIDELLHRSLHSLQGDVSPQDWSEIQRRLEQKRKNKPVFWFIKNLKGIGLATFALLVFTCAGYFTFNKTTEKIPSATEKGNLLSGRDNETKTPVNINNPSEIETNNNDRTDINEESGSINENHVNNNIRYVEKGINKPDADKTNNSKSVSSEPIETPEQPVNFGAGNTGFGENLAGNSDYKNGISEKDFSAKTDMDQLQHTQPDMDSLPANETSDVIDGKEIDSDQNDKSHKKNTLVNSKSFMPNTLQGKFAIGISFSSGSGGRKIFTDASKAEQVHKDYYLLRREQETGSGNFSASIFTQYYIWKGLNLQSGVQYTRQTEKATYKFYNHEIPVIDSATRNILGYIHLEDTIGTSYSGTNTYSYAVIPLQIGYEFPVLPRWSIGLKAGGSAMFLTTTKGKTLRSDDLTLTDISNLHKTNFSMHVSPSIYYRFQKCFSIGLEMNYSQFVDTIQDENATVQTKPWNFGAGMSLRYFPL